MIETVLFVVALGWIIKAFRGWTRFFLVAILVIGVVACL